LLFGLLLLVAACSSNEPPPDAEPQATHQLSAPENCDQLRERLVNATTEAILHARYGGIEIDDKVGGKGDNRDEEEESSEDYDFETDTEVRVEEDDVVKVVGSDVFVLSERAMSIVRSTTDGGLEVVGRVGLGDDLSAAGMFVDGDDAILISIIEDGRGDAEFGGTRVTRVDVSDHTKPEVTDQFDVEGDYEFARLVGDDYYLVTTNPIRAGADIWEIAYSDVANLPAPEPGAPTARQIELRDKARADVRAMVGDRLAETPKLLPRLRRDFDDPAPLFSCSTAWGAAPASSVRFTSVTRFAASGEPETVAVTGDRPAIYVDGRDLWLAFADRWGAFDGKSRLHLFALGDELPSYVASGLVDGKLVDEWSVHARDRVGRLITASDSGAAVHTFEVIEGKLEAENAVDEIGADGLVVANRFTRDGAFVATFGERERIWAVDLAKASVQGPYELGGLATMIHEMGDDRVLVVAQEQNDQDEMVGVRLEVFSPDSGDEPLAADSVSTGPFSAWSEAMWDPRSLAYDPDAGLVAFPVNIAGWSDNGGEDFSGMLVYDATSDGLELKGTVDHTDLVARRHCLDNDQPADCGATGERWWTHVRRAAFVDGRLITISETGVKTHDVETLEETAAVLVE
jgi:uncharacterized secreted protein with C-terminal beta-propeller domain